MGLFVWQRTFMFPGRIGQIRAMYLQSAMASNAEADLSAWIMRNWKLLSVPFWTYRGQGEEDS